MIAGHKIAVSALLVSGLCTTLLTNHISHAATDSRLVSYISQDRDVDVFCALHDGANPDTRVGQLRHESPLQVLQAAAFRLWGRDYDPTVHDIKEDYYSRTALMFAVTHQNVQIVQALLADGANVNIRSNHGTTALALAQMKNNPALVEILLSHGATL